MHRLTAGIKGDVTKRLTVLCLFLDFEKAFDSVWKKGLVVKLWNVGVHGCFLGLIDSFLFNKQVQLLINGFIGPIRNCLDIGLPQGAALSPVLFKFYVYDIDVICYLYSKNLEFYKFADDGSIKVTGETLEECLYYLNLVLGSISDWTSKWRLVVNCNTNKTEVICFSAENYDDVPTSFRLGQNTIQLVESSKVLGVFLDRKLNFKEHSNFVYNNMMYKWITVCRSCNRNWGLCHLVIARLTKSVLLSSVFYGCSIWMTDANILKIDRLWCKIAKTAVGAIFNVNQSVLEVIMGIPPLQVQKHIITMKHYLKAVTADRDSDNYLCFIMEECRSSNSGVISIIKDVFKFLAWKMELEPDNFSESDRLVVLGRHYENFDTLSSSCCFYSKYHMNHYTENLWQSSLQNRLQQMGERRAPVVTTRPIPLPLGTNRKTEVLVLSLFYKQNLLNSFLYLSQRIKCKSPLCKCLEEEQTAHHILVSCKLIDIELRTAMDGILHKLNGGRDSVEEVPADYISLLN